MLSVGSYQLAEILKQFFISMDGVYAENCLEQFQRISMDGVYAENCLEQFQRISMDGVYAENRLERFQCAFN